MAAIADKSSNTGDTQKSAGAKKNKKAIIAIAAAAALVLGGGVASAVAVNNYNTETQALCVAATDKVAEARTTAKTAQQGADAALAAVEDTTLPESAGTSTKYADRKAVEEVKAQKAEGDKPEVKAVPARQSGADFVGDVTDAKEELTKAEKALADTCETRDNAAASDTQVKAVTDAAKKLDAASTALTEDFALFQADEAARLAAEKKAAEEAAAAEAARIAAEQAAAEEAARQAEQESWDNSYGGGYDDGYYNPGNGGGGGGGNSGGGGTIIVPPNGGGGCPPNQPVCYG
ncbi:hypothetical protein ICL81_08010 [Leucobacter sp. cx-328]|uniref:hypothetical protein n=1 Tax=unclassified Leucobacter TaxID=2621730 RepID=UPI00165DEB86|nr:MULTISPECIES: hypothetical protein [unclassified Leucobacter]MBC9944452.1 hypothetical protein [Leucobacter sp. cx-328]